jgi:hypothetical protein
MMMLVSGCSSLPVSRDADLRARRHLEVADSLERATSLREAALEYTIVAEHYAGTMSYQTAVYKTALLYCDPLNPAADDSTALHWLAICRRIELPEDEARTVRVAAALFERVRVLREQTARMSASYDALTAQAKRQNATLGIHLKRIQELEEELKRLKEIDLRMSRTRQKK